MTFSDLLAIPLASDEELEALASVVSDVTAEADRWAGLCRSELPEHVASVISDAAGAYQRRASALECRLRGVE